MNGTYKVDMSMNTNIFILFAITLILTGCSSTEMNRDIYNALIQRECIKKIGEPNCDSGQPGYDEYQRELEEMNKQE